MVVMGPDYRGEQFPREGDNTPLTLYINITLLAFPKIDVLKLIFSGKLEKSCTFQQEIFNSLF
jgi:hypothetical protein